MIPNEIREIQSYLDTIPYGEVILRVKRVNRKTVEVVTYGTETLRFTDNQAAVDSLVSIINSLIKTEHTGTVGFELTLQEGRIKVIAMKDAKQTKF